MNNILFNKCFAEGSSSKVIHFFFLELRSHYATLTTVLPQPDADIIGMCLWSCENKLLLSFKPGILVEVAWETHSQAAQASLGVCICAHSTAPPAPDLGYDKQNCSRNSLPTTRSELKASS